MIITLCIAALSVLHVPLYGNLLYLLISQVVRVKVMYRSTQHYNDQGWVWFHVYQIRSGGKESNVDILGNVTTRS